MSLDQLPELVSISGDSLLKWERLWCPLGGQIAMEGNGWDDAHRGFLAEPSAYRNQNCRPLREWIKSESGVWALCGAPGSGKSGAIRLWLDELKTAEPDTLVVAVTSKALGNQSRFDQLFQIREFQSAQEAGKPILLVIDGFDQFRTDGGPPFESLALSLASLDRKKLRLVIGCRARDWHHNQTRQLLKLWPSSPACERVLEICPLMRTQVHAAAAARQSITIEKFAHAIWEAREEAAAHWPLSLRSLLDSYVQDGSLAGSSTGRISKTITVLLRDEAASLSGRDPSKIERLRQCARRLAALLVLSGHQGVSRSRSAAEGILPSDEFVGSVEFAREAINGVSFPIVSDDLYQLCGTALMAAIRPPSASEPEPAMGFTHQSYAEVLAGQYLRNLDVDQLKGILTVAGPAGNRVPSQLVEVASWLAAIHSKWFDYLLEITPEILLRSDGAHYSGQQKHRLMGVLLVHAAQWDASALAEVRLLTPSFSFPGLVDSLRPVITDSNAPELSRRLAIQVTGQCRLSELEEELWTVLERRDENEPRYWATSALHSILQHSELSKRSVERLTAAALNEMGPDDDDQLKGIALQCLVPRVLKPREVVPWLTIPKNSSLFGSYEGFLHQVLPKNLTADDVESFLYLGASTPSIFHVEFTTKELPREVLKIFAGITSPSSGMKAGFAGWVLRCAGRHTSLPLTEDDYDFENSQRLTSYVVNEDIRRTWLTLMADYCSKDQAQPFFILRALCLSSPPLDWLLNSLNTAQREQYKFWADLSRFSIWDAEKREACLPLLLTTYAQVSELRNALAPCEEGLNIHDTYLVKAKEQEEKEKQYAQEEKRRSKKRVTRREWLDQFLNEWKAGDELAWINIMRACALSEAGYSEWGGDFVADLKGWKSLSLEEQSEVKRCAREFLLRQDDPCRGLEMWNATVGSESAAFAIGLIADDIESDTELSAAIREKWVAAWVRHYSNVSERAQHISAMLYCLNPGVIRSVMRELFLKENEAGTYCRSIPLLKNCWGSELSEMFSSWLSDADLKPVTLRTGIEFLAEHDHDCTLKLVSIWLRRIETEEVPESIKDVIIHGALLNTRGTLFETALLRLAEPSIARRILCLSDHGYGNPGQGLVNTLNELSTEQLGKLTIVMAHAFPEESFGEADAADEVPVEAKTAEELERRSGSNVRNVTAADSWYRVSTLVMAKFAQVAASEELEAVRQQLPHSRRLDLPFARSNALKQVAQSEWRGVLPSHLLKLVQKAQACFIRSNDDLLEFILGRLKAFDAKRWNIMKKPLWNEPYGLPPTAKEENELSNRLKIWLDENLQLIVNREVQPVELLEKRLDLKIEIPGDPRLCVIVEVKKVENREVETSMQTQLVDTYLMAGGQTHGIYAVALFGDKAPVLKGGTLKGMGKRLAALQSALRKPDAVRAEFLLMDFRHPKLEATPKKKRRHKPEKENGITNEL